MVLNWPRRCLSLLTRRVLSSLPLLAALSSLTLLTALTVACRAKSTPTPTPTIPRVPTFTVPSSIGGYPAPPTSPTPAATSSEPGTQPDRPAPATFPPSSTEMVICMAGEPEDIFLWSTAESAAKRTVLHALYGPGTATNGIASFRGFAYRPAILAKLPSLADGDARLTDVTVLPGAPIVDAETGALMLYRGSPTTMPQLTVSFRLRHDLSWSDGTPLTARDSVFAFRVARDPSSGYPRRDLVDRTARYIMVDEYTTEWTGIPGYLPSTYFLNVFDPLPEHILKNLSPGEIRFSDFARRPLGYGPFALEEWLPGHHMTVVRNPFYWKAAQGVPSIRRLIFRFPVTAEQALPQLIGGGCDIVTSDALPPDQIPAILAAEKQGTVQAAFAPDSTWEQIAFNLQPADERPPLGAQKELRQALAYGFNRQAMVDQVWHGQNQVMDSIVLPDHPYYPSTGLATYPYDPEKARTLLEEAGWRDADGDGIREAHSVRFTLRETPEVTHTVDIAASTPLSLTLLITTDDPLRHQVTELLQRDMQAIGVGIAIESVVSVDLFADGPDGPLFGRRFDLVEFAWTPPSGLAPRGELFLCDLIPSDRNVWLGNNATGFCNPAYDAAVRAAQKALDETEAAIHWTMAQNILADALPAIPLFPYMKTVIARPNVVGLQPDASEPGELYNIDEIHP